MSQLYKRRCRTTSSPYTCNVVAVVSSSCRRRVVASSILVGTLRCSPGPRNLACGGRLWVAVQRVEEVPDAQGSDGAMRNPSPPMKHPKTPTHLGPRSGEMLPVFFGEPFSWDPGVSWGTECCPFFAAPATYRATQMLPRKCCHAIVATQMLPPALFCQAARSSAETADSPP